MPFQDVGTTKRKAMTPKRREDAHRGIRPPSQIKSAGFSPSPPQRRASSPIEKLKLGYQRP